MLKLALRPYHDDPGWGVYDPESNTLSASPSLMNPQTPSLTSHHAAQGDSDKQRRSSFLRRRFSPIWTQRTQKTENATDEGVRGPLGLRLLFASPEPMIDIIFVHGLGGGSVKTWRKGNDPRLFWPQHWLPSETEFRNASIHSFGYVANWKASQPSILGVHDFGQALYEEIRSSSVLRRNPKVYAPAVIEYPTAVADLSHSHRAKSFSWGIPWADLSSRRYIAVNTLQLMSSVAFSSLVVLGTHLSLPRSGPMRHFGSNPGHILSRYTA